jgi:prephenate dehydratase
MNKVAFQGEPGAFSEEAAFKLCGANCMVLPCRTFQAVVDAVERGTVQSGVLPVENSSIGKIHSSLEVLNASKLLVKKDMSLPIHHCLMGLPGTSLDEIQRVISHPAAIAQCQGFLSAHPAYVVEEWYDTAGAAREVASKKDATLSAIASRRAAARYKLEILGENIEDADDNTTRFVLVTL